MPGVLETLNDPVRKTIAKKHHRARTTVPKLAARKVVGKGGYGEVVEDPLFPDVVIKESDLFQRASDETMCAVNANVREYVMVKYLRKMIRDPKWIAEYVWSCVSPTSENPKIEIAMTRATCSLARWIETTPASARLAQLPAIAMGVLTAVHSLHESGIVHGDVTAANFLIHAPVKKSDGVRVRLADFGAYSLMHARIKKWTCPHEYRSKESLCEDGEEDEYDCRLQDSWSVGVVLYYATFGKMLIGNRPSIDRVRREYADGTIQKTIDAAMLPGGDKYKSVRDILRATLVIDHRRRKTVTDVLSALSSSSAAACASPPPEPELCWLLRDECCPRDSKVRDAIAAVIVREMGDVVDPRTLRNVIACATTVYCNSKLLDPKLRSDDIRGAIVIARIICVADRDDVRVGALGGALVGQLARLHLS